jgi:hypothetical protein
MSCEGDIADGVSREFDRQGDLIATQWIVQVHLLIRVEEHSVASRRFIVVQEKLLVDFIKIHNVLTLI